MLDEVENAVKPIKGIILDEIFFDNQNYKKQALGVIAEANSKNIPVIIFCESQKNEISMSQKLTKIKSQAIATYKKKLSSTLFGFKLNLSDCLHVCQKNSDLQKKVLKNNNNNQYHEKIECLLIDSSVGFDKLLELVKKQEKQIRDANFVVDLNSDYSDDSVSTPRGGNLPEMRGNEKSSSCCSPGRWGMFWGGEVGLVAGGVAEYFLWPFVKAYVPAGDVAEIGLKLAFAVVVAGIGSGVGYAIGSSDCCAPSEVSYRKI